jgi:dUTP pyrophosphatase
MLNIKVKSLSPKAVIPQYSKTGDAGLDLTATSMKFTENYIEYGTSLAFEIPEGYVGLIFPRSSISNYDLILANSVGVIDSNYRGEVTFRFKAEEFSRHHYNVGDRVGQLIVIPHPQIQLIESEELSESSRGDKGYGSSGV